ncbi:MAG: hypothetical protein R3E79_11590 [Caldilineaceae bacterium]
MKQPTDSYQSYLLRLWQEECNGVPVWRASVESVQTRTMGVCRLTGVICLSRPTATDNQE